MAVAALTITLLAQSSCACAPAARFQRGFALTGWNADSYLRPRSDRLIARMAAAGSSTAAVFTQWFMDAPDSSHIAPDLARTPSDASIEHAADAIHEAGLEVTLKPQVGIRSGEWIAMARPSDLDAWWADYRTMLVHYADLAERVGAATLVIGTEMRSLSRDDARWRALIAELREHFHGALTYAANYDEFQAVPFWDALDYIGIDAYFPLADPGDSAPPVEQLATAWTTRGYLQAIAAVSRRFGKKVLFTELGYRGVHATAAHPNFWSSANDVTDTQAQANAYQAFYAAVAGQPWMAGVYWWEVNADHWWAGDYSPLGKPAADVMTEWNRRIEASPEQFGNGAIAPAPSEAG